MFLARCIKDVLRRVIAMVFVNAYLVVFWCLPWSAPLRAALSWQPALLSCPSMPPAAPRWLRPLCVQRWVGQAVANCVAWVRAQDGLVCYRFGNDSAPDWHPVNLERYSWRALHALCEEDLRWLLGMEIERRLRLALTPPEELGVGAWVAASLAACEHVAQVYHEFRRRVGARRARAIVREELGALLAWGTDAVT